MRQLFVLVIISLCYTLNEANQLEDYLVSSCSYQPPYDDDHLTMLDRLKSRKYPSEVHYITTEDGYILTTYRIPYGRNCGKDQQRKRPVLCMHGLLGSSNDWVSPANDEGLVYMLADDCFDVWIGNSRGNMESKNHTTLNITSHEYWSFSWHEMGQYDDPAMIKYILKETKQDQMYWVGHSQGTTQFFVYSSLYPSDSKKYIRQMHALAPVAYITTLSAPAWIVASGGLPLSQILAEKFEVNQYNPYSPCNEWFLKTVCQTGTSETTAKKDPNLDFICKAMMEVLFGYNGNQMNMTLFPRFIAKDPAGAALRQFLHYGQLGNSKRFCQYDFLAVDNLKKYGRLTPPSYKVKNIQTPIWLHYSEQDTMAWFKDVERLHREIKNYSYLNKVKKPFNHFDYLYGKDANTVLYNFVMAEMNKAEEAD